MNADGGISSTLASITLREALVESFNFEELEVMCRDLALDPEILDIYQRGKVTWVEEIIRYFLKRNEVERLRRECAQMRPGAPYDWESLPLPNLPPSDRNPHNVEGVASPYVGLSAFTYNNRASYAGRERESSEAVEQLTGPGVEQTLLFITGPSGCGKSSFAQAGLIPELERFYAGRGLTCRHAERRPTLRPMAVVTALLSMLGDATDDVVRVVLIDQFEEVFAPQCDPNERAQLLAWLTSLPPFAQSRLHVLATIRSDYLHMLADSKELWAVAKDAVVLRAMSTDELREAIQRPVRQLFPHKDKWFEPTLVIRLATDAATNNVYLPLLQVVLEDIWKSGRLVLASYDGLEGAIRARADAVWEYADADNPRPRTRREPSEQAEVLRILIDLVNVSSDDDARRDVRAGRSKKSISETDATGVSRAKLVDDLIKARLLSVSDESGESMVNITHESLIANWDRLRDAITTERRRLQMRSRFEQQLKLWLANERKDEYLLLTPVQLAEARQLTETDDIVLRDLADAKAFCDQSNALAEAELQRELQRQKDEVEKQRQLVEEQRQRADAQTRAARRLRALVGVVVALALTALLAGGAILTARQQAQTAAAARSRYLASIAESQLFVNSNRARLIGIAAYKESPTREALDFLQHAIMTPEQYVLTLNKSSERTVNEGGSSISQIRFSPDGKKLLAFGGRIDLWDVIARKHLYTFGGDSAVIWDAQFSNDGKRIFAGSDDGLMVWNAETGDPITTTFAISNVPSGIRISPDGKHIVTFDSAPEALKEEWTEDTLKAHIWDIETGVLGQEFDGHTAPINDAAFSKSGKWLATAGQDGVVLVWDLDAQTEAIPLHEHLGTVSHVAFSSDDRLLATAGTDGKFVVLDAATWTKKFTFQFGTKVNSVAFSAGSQRVVAASDRLAIVWDIHTGAKVGTARVNGAIAGAVFSSNDDYVLIAVDDGTAELFHASTGKISNVFGDHEGKVLGASLSPDDRVIATLDEADTIRLWDSPIDDRFMGHTQRVWSAALSPDETRLVTASHDGTARVWDMTTGRTLLTLLGHKDEVQYAEFSPDGRFIVTASQDGTARVWDAQTGMATSIVLSHTDEVHTARFSQDGRQILTSGQDGAARLWDVRTGKEVRKYVSGSQAIQDARFSHNQKLVVTAVADGTVNVWDAANVVLKLTLVGHGGQVFSAVFSPDDQYILSGSYDQTARLWDASTGQLIRTFSGHDDSVFYVDFSPDGRKVATASVDYTVRVWDTSSGELLNILRGHDGVVNYAAFSRAGTFIVSSGSSTTVHIHPLQSDVVIGQVLRRIVGELACWERVRFLGEAIVCPISVSATSPRR